MSLYPKGRATKPDLSKIDVMRIWSDTGPVETRATPVVAELKSVSPKDPKMKAQPMPLSLVPITVPHSKATAAAPVQVTQSPVGTRADDKVKMAKPTEPVATKAQATPQKNSLAVASDRHTTLLRVTPSPVSAPPAESTVSPVKKAKVAVVSKTRAVATTPAPMVVQPKHTKSYPGGIPMDSAATTIGTKAAPATAVSSADGLESDGARSENHATTMAKRRADDKKEGISRPELRLSPGLTTRLQAYATTLGIKVGPAAVRILDQHLPAAVRLAGTDNVNLVEASSQRVGQ